MSDMMTFPATVEEFMEQYKIVDDEKVYTNGADLVPIFRMMQWFEHVSATDTISRQMAIDAVCSICGNDCDKSKFVYNAPQDEQVIMCPEHYVLSTLPSAQPEPCEDAVSRKVVQDTIHKWCRDCVDCGTIADEVIAKIPPVTPKQRTGKWILDRSGAYCCSECMEPCAGYVMMKPRDKFCKMCGAKMTEGDAE